MQFAQIHANSGVTAFPAGEPLSQPAARFAAVCHLPSCSRLPALLQPKGDLLSLIVR